MLWVPCEDFILSNQFRDAYDTINANELRWYTWDGLGHAILMSRTADHADNTSYASSMNWATLYTNLKEANKLESTQVINGLVSATFLSTGFDPCTSKRVSVDLVFDQQHGGQAFRLSETVQFLQKHKDCQ